MQPYSTGTPLIARLLPHRFEQVGFYWFGPKPAAKFTEQREVQCGLLSKCWVRVSSDAWRYLVFKGNFMKVVIRLIYHNGYSTVMSENFTFDFGTSGTKRALNIELGVFCLYILGVIELCGTWECHEPSGKHTHVHSHKISGSINSWSPSMGPPEDLWTPVSCSKIYIHGVISKLFLSENKINWRQHIQHESIFYFRCYI